ncbi:hypothetical protein [Clostridium sp. ZS2-4]|uniref:hypothetical protein n=1 Tax=Clostridium sp. ZS2-4 TaxID=2987703 RepID=UPI00227A1B13|nr:hypothetical protein [Clostridium sp. ZS2-4]MCY6355373.1 hypothetical protein [Clostridium sp. ZS2-4]
MGKNNFDIKKSVENIEEIFKESIAYNLSCEIEKTLQLNDIYFETIKHKFRCSSSYNSIRDLESLTKTELLITVLDEEPFIMLNEMLPNIKEKQIFKSIENINSDDDYTKHEFNIYDELKCDEFSIITHVDKPSIEYGDYYYLTNIVNYDVKYIDLFNKKVYLEGMFIRKNNVSVWDVEGLGLKIYCDVKGVLKEDDIPTFIEYLLESCLHIKYKNKKMAFFNLFACFDNFIEILYEKTFNFYVKTYAKHIEELDIYIKDELEDIKSDEYDRIYSEIFVRIESYFKNKIRYYANQNRRLIDEKLFAVLKDLNIRKNNNYSKFNQNVSELKDIESRRNKIAHGEKFEFDESIGEVAYKILTVMCSILYEQDFFENEWNYLIYDVE